MLIVEILLVLAIAGSAVALITTVRALWSPAVDDIERIGTSEPVRGRGNQVTAPQEWKCSSCGALQPPENRFCGQCGNPVEKASCPQCGQEVSAMDRFCGRCGATIGEKK